MMCERRAIRGLCLEIGGVARVLRSSFRIAGLRGMSVVGDVERGTHPARASPFDVAPEGVGAKGLKVFRLRRKAEILQLLSACRAEHRLSRRLAHISKY
jgi:hypothetical protein